MKMVRDLQTCISSPAYLFSEGPVAARERRARAPRGRTHAAPLPERDFADGAS